jgi:hypothetical protein
LRRPPGELELVELELIQLTLGFREATPELLDVAFQTVAPSVSSRKVTVSLP